MDELLESMAADGDVGVHRCTDNCDCFTECPECGEPFCTINSSDAGDEECLAHFGGDWDLRDHHHEPTKGQLTGAYVQAWVWVEWDHEDHEGEPEPEDIFFVTVAKQQYEHEGDVEFDDNAKVSRSYE